MRNRFVEWLRTYYRAILPLLAVAIILVAIFGTIFYWRHQAQVRVSEDNRDSQRQDYALCIVQNQNRKDINELKVSERRVAGAFYSVLAARIANDPPENEATLHVFKVQAHKLAKELDALKTRLPKIDCSSYVRPDLPPDTGVPIAGVE